MNEEPVWSDRQAQPASAATQSAAASTTITSGRGVFEKRWAVIVGQSEAIDLALVTLLAGDTR